MKKQEHSTVFRKDYTPPTHLVERIDLVFKLAPDQTVVTAKSHIKCNPERGGNISSICLQGEELVLKSICINGTSVDEKRYKLTEKSLEIYDVPSEFELETITWIVPEKNTSLSGLYRSNGNYCTQCEAEGFRKITYSLDRPDVMSVYTVRIEGDRKETPILLANGNLLEEGALDEKNHYTIWHDPHPKPSYLFALVAGDLVPLDDEFVTASGKKVLLQIFVEPRNREKCAHAMRSLKKAMRWDEVTYGREYDLDRYMIVAVDDFNMGAMENKGLNVFNSKYVLALPETATDQDYLGIEGVIAHEYFHNWTGNRVTCRDWFQLSLKEGLTVYRDQEFSADMNSRPVQRIDDVNLLRNFQFREDAGPMAHPVRPDSYVEINNFYTVTVYNKGAEVIRMINAILGKELFRKGMDLYFERHDGQAVTCDDFVAAMSDASGKDLEQFTLWYGQSGTPMIEIIEEWNEQEKEFTLNLQQSCPPTPGQKEKKPFHIPIELGLLDKDGNDIDLEVVGEEAGLNHLQILELHNEKERFVFRGCDQKPILSFLRNFSAPVKVKSHQSREELAFIMANDSDLFNRWDAATRLGVMMILELASSVDSSTYSLDGTYLEAFRKCLTDRQADRAIIAQAITIPAETYISQEMSIIDPDNLHRARNMVIKELRTKLLGDFIHIYQENNVKGAYSITPEAMGVRSLKNCCLKFMMAGEEVEEECLEMCLEQYHQSTNMTDSMGALGALIHYPGSERDDILTDFYKRWRGDSLVVDKWFSLQAVSSLKNTLSKVKMLLNHPAFSIKNPNKVRALIGAFCSGNHVRFHDISGNGYRFLTEQIRYLDSINPQIAARMVTPFVNWKRYDNKRQALIHEQLKYLANQKTLSADVAEIVEKSL